MLNYEVETPAGPTTLKIDLFDDGDTPVWRAAFGSDPEQVYFFEYQQPGEGTPTDMQLDLIELAVTARH